MTSNPYRELPQVNSLADEIGDGLPRPLAIAIARDALGLARDGIEAGETPDVIALGERLARSLRRSAGTRVINATGILLHTNLGRATWSEAALAAAGQAAAHPANIELDLASGERGRRGAYVQALLREATGAEAATVVNNNAAALLLTLAAIARGRSVPVARGELIEIGGSYRLPAVMETSGAKLIEVGTTNRTRAADYLVATQTHHCAALLKVHPSNFRVEGFTEEADLGQLAEIASETGIPLLYDLGSGWLDSAVPWAPSWLRNEPAVRQSLQMGADAVMFSGDKLLGGPQAGIVVGTSEVIDQLRAHPLARALRVDGVTLAALAATLEEHLSGSPVSIPFWRQALAEAGEIEKRATQLAGSIGGEVEDGESRVGAGSAPGMPIPTSLVRLRGRHDLFTALLEVDTPVLSRRDEGGLILDLRSVDPAEDADLIAIVQRCQ